MLGIDKKNSFELNRRHRPDYLLILYTGLLMLLGLVVIYAIGPQRANVLNAAYGSEYSDMYFFMKQIISLALSVGVFFAMAYIPHSLISKHAGKIVLFALVSCLLLTLAGLANMGFAQQSLGATRWFNLGPLGSFQPSELLKYALLLFSATFLGVKSKQGKINDFNETLLPLALTVAVSLLLVVVVQKDFGTGASIVGIIIAMLFMGGLNIKNGLIVFIAIAVLGSVFIVSSPHRIVRLQTFLQGDKASSSVSKDSSYHIEHAKLAIGTGGLFGVGIGNSVQATGYLPEAINDSVFAIMGETFGFVGLVAIILLFIGLMARLLKVMDHLPDMRLKLFVAGVFGWVASHVILNISSMLGIIPLTGITLPLLSLGGTSMLFISAALGVVFQLSHYTVHSSNLKEASHEDSSSRRRVGRSRYARSSSSTRN